VMHQLAASEDSQGATLSAYLSYILLVETAKRK
jgi:hypothetical protein